MELWQKSQSNTLASMSDWDRISPYNLTLRYKFKQTSDKKKKINQWIIGWSSAKLSKLIL